MLHRTAGFRTLTHAPIPKAQQASDGEASVASTVIDSESTIPGRLADFSPTLPDTLLDEPTQCQNVEGCGAQPEPSVLPDTVPFESAPPIVDSSPSRPTRDCSCQRGGLSEDT